MPTPEEIRKGLTVTAAEREAADVLHRDATARMKELLRAASAHPDMSMAEAARLAKVTRSGAYKMLREDPEE